MTAIPSPYFRTRLATTRATFLDRALLRTAAALDAVVQTRLERRAGDMRRHHAFAAQEAATTARRHAEALAALGMLPR
jgi:hypothetical protein